MMQKRTCAAMFCLVIVVALNTARAGPATAPAVAKDVDNPLFAAWTKFDEGTSATYETDLPVANAKMHLVGTVTLKKKTAEGVTIESASTLDGKESPSQTQNYPAKVAAADVKKTGEQDVKIGDKTYKCVIYEISGSAMGTGVSGAPPITVYVSDEVPGGLVKVSGKDSAGKEMSVELTSFKAK